MDDSEHKHLKEICRSFRLYETAYKKVVYEEEEQYLSLAPVYKALLPDVGKKRFDTLRSCLATNASFLKRIASSFQAFPHCPDTLNTKIDSLPTVGIAEAQDCEETDATKRTSMLDTVDYVDRLPTVLRLCLRDWSAEGKEERNASYFHILNALSRWKEDVAERAKLTVLCPGAGLGRLPYEISKLGFHCEGNEFSYFMLLTSNYILNEITCADSEKIYPFVHQSVNHLSFQDRTRSITFPDVAPC
mmetsp:Transcript_28472/g.72559  ORF Transcript_28472/g.72559 Transcript_28472/m.72559 type:complete len:246 (-) Transcript_28472:2133-2870(-)